MFEITRGEDGSIRLSGRLDASNADKAREFLGTIRESCILDFERLEYISSAGLGVLLGTQKRLGESGDKLTLRNLNSHIRDLFRVAGFDLVFEIK